MDSNILDNLNIGEKYIEMEESTLHDMDIIEVTIYTCKRNIFGFRVIDTYKFPFYFTSKELVEKFIKYYNYFRLYEATYYHYGSERKSLLIQAKGNKENFHKWYMIDEKQLSYHNTISYDPHLASNGIWGGKVSWDGNGYVPIDEKHIKDFMGVIDEANIPVKKEKTYIFKMVENK